MVTSTTLGLLLAAGAGTRMGTPKALVEHWLTRQVTVLLDAGCSPVIVVLGAGADAARQLVPGDDRVRVAIAADWERGLSASLVAGLGAANQTDAAAAVIVLVDLPGLPVAAVARLRADAGRAALRQATYGGRPGHPVLIGRDHWAPLAAQVSGDAGARDYLAAHDAVPIECSDLWDGRDVDER